MNCTRCNKRLSRKTARMIDGDVVCSTCMFAPPKPVDIERVAKNCANFHPFRSLAVGYRSRGWCQVCGVPWQEFEVGELYRCQRFTPRDSGRLPKGEDSRSEAEAEGLQPGPAKQDAPNPCYSPTPVSEEVRK